MKTHRFISLVILFATMQIVFATGQKEEVKNTVVRVYAYDSFTADWGAGKEIAKRFFEKTGYTVEYVTTKDGGSMLSRMILEKNNPTVDVALGIDNYLFSTAKKMNLLSAYKPQRANEIDADLYFSDEWLLSPFDWGYFTIMYNKDASVPAPKTLADLTQSQYKKNLVTMDPRTSTPGLGFVAWTSAAFKDDASSFWKALKPNLLAMTPGWSAGYSLFTAGESAMVVSYTTSMAYHIQYDKTDKFQALIFPEGHIRQVEGVGVVKGAKNVAGARAFVDFMLSDEAQSLLPTTQWMYPVSKTVALPESFKAVPLPQKTLTISGMQAGEAREVFMSIISQ